MKSDRLERLNMFTVQGRSSAVVKVRHVLMHDSRTHMFVTRTSRGYTYTPTYTLQRETQNPE